MFLNERSLMMTVDDSRYKGFRTCSFEVGFLSERAIFCCLLRQPYSVQQVCEARIGAKVVVPRIDFDEENTRTH